MLPPEHLRNGVSIPYPCSWRSSLVRARVGGRRPGRRLCWSASLELWGLREAGAATVQRGRAHGMGVRACR